MSDEGASPRELLLEACRRDNVSLLEEVISACPSHKEIAHLLNTATDGVGSHCLHIAASHGSYEVLDVLLDQEGLEVDPTDRLEKDTPLHKAVRYANQLPQAEWGQGAHVVELLVDAGADPKMRNKAKLKAVELVDPRNADLRATLQRAEYAQLAGNDVVDVAAEEEEGPTGSGSDSDETP